MPTPVNIHSHIFTLSDDNPERTSAIAIAISNPVITHDEHGPEAYRLLDEWVSQHGGSAAYTITEPAPVEHLVSAQELELNHRVPPEDRLRQRNDEVRRVLTGTGSPPSTITAPAVNRQPHVTASAETFAQTVAAVIVRLADDVAALTTRIGFLEQRLAEMEQRHDIKPFLDTYNDLWVKYPPGELQHRGCRRRDMRAHPQG